MMEWELKILLSGGLIGIGLGGLAVLAVWWLYARWEKKHFAEFLRHWSGKTPKEK